ncbi:MAG TPA: hypothetical protein VGX76_03345 [Pirellulales bacterium]|nr:hypothetical protein [Pirellulales bacterium]
MTDSPRRSRRRRVKPKPPLTLKQILEWVDAHFERTGRWPSARSGPVGDAFDTQWHSIEAALRAGNRGLPRGSSLRRLLSVHRGVRNRAALPPYSLDGILAWADAHRLRSGAWPQSTSGPIVDAPGETWTAVDSALGGGLRGLAGGTSLARLLAQHRGVRNLGDLSPLTLAGILAWADAHFARNGGWPNRESGPIPEASGDTWAAVNRALQAGSRGLRGKTTLTKLLAERRGAPRTRPERLWTVEQILGWADAHFARHGAWPSLESGAIDDAPGHTWNAVDLNLKKGYRGLPGGTSLGRLLAERRGVRNQTNAPRLSVERILAWADAYHARHGRRPTLTSGPIEDAPGENWGAVQIALIVGGRGLPGGSSLAKVLDEHRGKRKSPLTVAKILEWADAHHRRTLRYPLRKSGVVREAPGETWGALDSALLQGCRGLEPGSSLARLLAEHRGFVRRPPRPRLTNRQIVAWADFFFARHRRWPSAASGAIVGARGETWGLVDQALRAGRRGLPGGSSLARFLAEHRGARNRTNLRSLTVEEILKWADAHYRWSGTYPTRDSCAVSAAQGETWSAIDAALFSGHRGLAGGSSLTKLLAEHRGVRDHRARRASRSRKLK